MRHFAFSPRVLAIINRSLHLLAPSAKPYEMYPEVSRRSARPGPWKNLLALHLRRGGPGYCEELGERTAYVAIRQARCGRALTVPSLAAR